MYLQLRCAFELAVVTDMLVLILDRDQGASVTNDIEGVVRLLSIELPGGLGRRRLYYQDTLGRFDEILVRRNSFAGFRPASPAQQEYFRGLLLGASPGRRFSGAHLVGDGRSSPIPF